MAEVRIDIYFDWRCKRCRTVIYGPMPTDIVPGGALDPAFHEVEYIAKDGKRYRTTCPAKRSEGEYLDRSYVAVMKSSVRSGP